MHPHPLPLDRFLPVTRKHNENLVIPKGSTIQTLSSSDTSSQTVISSGKLRDPQEGDNSFSPFWRHRMDPNVTDSGRHKEESSEQRPAVTQAIPIPHRRRPQGSYDWTELHEMENEEQAIERAKEHYELATWALYERVAAYREKNPAGQEYLQQQQQREERTEMLEWSHPRTSNRNNIMLETTSPHPTMSHDVVEDEIFAMEL